MKKIVVLLIILIFPLIVSGKDKITVKYEKCIDGDTAAFKYKDEIMKVRFLAIDTPETKHPKKGTEPFGKEASEYTCKRIKEAKKIEIEYDEKSEKKDKYDRYLAWIFVDDSLLQKELISKGLAKVDYLYGKYKYTKDIQEVEKTAQKSNLGVWSLEENKIEENEDLPTIIFIIIACIIIVIVAIINKPFRKKVVSKMKNEIEKKLEDL